MNVNTMLYDMDYLADWVKALFKEKKVQELPDQPSELIRVAIKDLNKAVRSKKKYSIDMDQWHVPNSHCSVCLAGSIMAFSMGVPSDRHAMPDDFPYEIERKLDACDDFRTGDVERGLRIMGLLDEVEDALPDITERFVFLHRNHIEYRLDPTKWRKQMYKLANDLEGIGL